MANLASSAVVNNESFEEGGNNSKKYIVIRATITLAAMGTATNKILASAFKLSKITRCSNLVKSDNSVVIPAVPAIDETYILAGGGAANVPADYTGSFNITVWGYRTGA